MLIAQLQAKCALCRELRGGGGNVQHTQVWGRSRRVGYVYLSLVHPFKGIGLALLCGVWGGVLF